MSDSTASPPPAPARLEPAELIVQVRQRACLWDRACAGYRSRPQRSEAWRAVCRALRPGYDCLSSAEQHDLGIMMMRKWYNIRDAFKKTYSLKGNSSAASRPYLYSDMLDFLVPKPKAGDKQKAVKDEAVDEDTEPGPVEWLNVFELDQSEAPPAKRSKPDTDRLQAKEKPEADESIMSVLINLMGKEDDEDRAFFKSITPAVKSLPDDVKFLFRIRVMELLDSLKKKSNEQQKKLTGSDTE